MIHIAKKLAVGALLITLASITATPAHANGTIVKFGGEIAKRVCKKPCQKFLARKGEAIMIVIEQYIEAINASRKAGEKIWEKRVQQRRKLCRIDVLHNLPIPQRRLSR